MMAERKQTLINGHLPECLSRYVPKVLKNPKGYDRVRDRKDKRLYEIEEEDLNETDEES